MTDRDEAETSYRCGPTTCAAVLRNSNPRITIMNGRSQRTIFYALSAIKQTETEPMDTSEPYVAGMDIYDQFIGEPMEIDGEYSTDQMELDEQFVMPFAPFTAISVKNF